MDLFSTLAISVAVLVILIILFICYILAPRTVAWLRSNREEKIGLSKNRIFNANGYLLQSGSSIFLGSNGSFKRFESVDREYSPQTGQTTATTPPWNNAPKKISFPPQPLRPAPKPGDEVTDPTLKKTLSVDQKPNSAPIHNSIVIPRPVPKKQLSAPVSSTISLSLKNPPGNMMTKYKDRAPKTCTNPFLNDRNGAVNSRENAKQNPFWYDTETEDVFNFEPDNIKSILEEVDPLKQVEDRISKLEESTKLTRKMERQSVVTSLLIDEKSKISEAACMLSEKEYVQNAVVSPSTSLDIMALSTLGPRKLFIADEQSLNLKASMPTVVTKDLRKQFKNRSFSETEFIMPQWLNERCNQTNPVSDSNLTKTVSETFLEQLSFYKNINSPICNAAHHNKIFHRQASVSSLENDLSTTSPTSTAKSILKGAISCDSVSSESSVVLNDLEQPVPPITGSLCVGLQYDKLNSTDDGVELYVTVLEAKDLIGPPDSDKMNTFIRIYLVPDETGAMQTRLFKDSNCPSYQETFSFWINRKQIRRSLWFHLYHTNARAHTLIGETEMKLDYNLNRPVTTWLTLSDSKHHNNIWGELMFSLSYLPTAERLTVVVVKARHLNIPDGSSDANTENGSTISSIENVYVKIYLLKNDKKVSKKKTTIKKGEKSPIFNEAMIFSVPPYILNSIQVRLTVVNSSAGSPPRNGRTIDPKRSDVRVCKPIPIGHVIVGCGTSGNGLRHWHQMLTSLRKPVAMWHELRQTNKSKK